MARRFLVDIISDVNSLLADNIDGDISPQDLRTPLLDMIDSLKQDEASISATGSTLGLATTVALADLTSVYDAQNGGDGDFLQPVFGSGTITGTDVAGFSYSITGAISVAATNNVAISLSVGVNGLQEGFVARHEASGATEYYTVGVRLFVNSAAADDVFTLMIATPDGITTVNIADANMTVVVHPTNDP